LTLPETTFQKDRNLFGGLATKGDTLDHLPTPTKNQPQPALSEIAAIMNGIQKVLQSTSNQSQAEFG